MIYQDDIAHSLSMDPSFFCDDDVGTSKTNGKETTGRWTREEHMMFIKGLEMFGKGWKKIAGLIKTRTVVQIRTHAQKYFLKLTKARQQVEFNGGLSLDVKQLGSGSRKRMRLREGSQIGVATVLAPFLRSSVAASTSVNSNTADLNITGSSSAITGNAYDGTRGYIDVDDALYSFLTPKLPPTPFASKNALSSCNSTVISTNQGEKGGIIVAASEAPEICGTFVPSSAHLDRSLQSSTPSRSSSITSVVASARPAAPINYESTDWFSGGGDLGHLLEGAEALNWDDDPGEAANLDEPETDILLLGEKAPPPIFDDSLSSDRDALSTGLSPRSSLKITTSPLVLTSSQSLPHGDLHNRSTNSVHSSQVQNLNQNRSISSITVHPMQISHPTGINSSQGSSQPQSNSQSSKTLLPQPSLQSSSPSISYPTYMNTTHPPISSTMIPMEFPTTVSYTVDQHSGNVVAYSSYPYTVNDFGTSTASPSAGLNQLGSMSNPMNNSISNLITSSTQGSSGQLIGPVGTYVPWNNSDARVLPTDFGYPNNYLSHNHPHSNSSSNYDSLIGKGVTANNTGANLGGAILTSNPSAISVQSIPAYRAPPGSYDRIPVYPYSQPQNAGKGQVNSTSSSVQSSNPFATVNSNCQNQLQKMQTHSQSRTSLLKPSSPNIYSLPSSRSNCY